MHEEWTSVPRSSWKCATLPCRGARIWQGSELTRWREAIRWKNRGVKEEGIHRGNAISIRNKEDM